MNSQKTLKICIAIVLFLTSSILTTPKLAFSQNASTDQTSLQPLSDGLPVLYVSPESNTGQINDYFTINIIVANVTDLYAVDIQFAWDPAILEYVNHTAMVPVEDFPGGILHEGILVMDKVDTTASMPGTEEGTMYWLAYASMEPAPVFDGTGTAFNMTFKVIKSGGCALEFTNLSLKELSDKPGNPINHERYDGYFESAGTPTARFSWSPTVGVVNEPVTFNASESSDPEGPIVNYFWDFDDGNTAATPNPVINHNFNHTKDKEIYYVSLIVEDNTGINSSKTIADPPLTVVQFRNIGLTRISLSTYHTLINTTIYVNVTIKNYGIVPENFTLTAYCNISSTDWALINTTTVDGNPYNMTIAPSGLPGSEVPHSFAWNTTTLPNPEAYYKVQVNVTGVPYDDETDNTITSKPVHITEDLIYDLTIETLSFRASHGVLTFPLPIILGEKAEITTTVKNLGTVPEEAFNVTLYINGTALKQWILSETLTSGAVKTLTWTWEEILERGYYNITAKVTVAIENVTENNILQDFLRVIETPQLEIIYTPDTPVVNETVTLNASSSIHREPGGQITGYAWEIWSPDQILDVGSPISDLTGVSVSYTFRHLGNWTIVLKVTDNFGYTYETRRTLTSDYRLDLEIPIELAEDGGGGEGIPIEYIVVIIVVVIVIIAALVIFYRRRQQSPAAA
ncbi:MAG: PKD domain-containing protein [Candidatus Bathyarchaeota archaeon]|nr:PKD domain-containing protein [Candidatus Bathyarchaeota archaeon]